MTKTVKDLITEKILQTKLKNAIRSDQNCPTFYDKLVSAKESLNSALNIQNIPWVAYLEETNSKLFNERFSSIKSWINTSAKSLDPILEEYRTLSNGHKSIAIRIFNESNIFKNMIDKMLNHSCFAINNRISNQTLESNCGNIGKYITLPFFISSTKMMDSAASFMLTSTGEIQYSNIADINYIPLSEWISIKVSGSKNESVTFNISLTEEKTSNAFYLRMLNNITKAKITFSLDSKVVYTNTYQDKEIFDNYLPISFNNITFTIDYNNSNIDKPFAIQIDKFEIFESIFFARTGQYETKEMDLKELGNISNVNLSYENEGDPNYTETKNMISLNSISGIRDYNIIDAQSPFDVSVYKYRNFKYFDQFDIDFNREIKIVVPEGMEDKAVFYRWIVEQETEPELWDMDYKNALLFHGIPVEYGKTTNIYKPSGELFYENWTKIDNYWHTMVIVYEDNVTVDIGKSTCILNGKERTGKILFPQGVSTLKVHEKYIDFKFGKVTSAYQDVTDQTMIYDDPLFPFNFAYLFSGLPDFSTEGQLEKVTSREYPISDVSSSTIILGEAFLPLSMKITDSEGHSYGLVLTKGITKRGTFSVEPYSGKIKVLPMEGAEFINIEYTRANPFRRPIGILFNRLLTYMPIKKLLGLTWTDDYNFFTLDGGPSEKALLVQKLADKKIVHSQLVFNTIHDSLYSFIKINMQTTNKFLTPIISDIFLKLG